MAQTRLTLYAAYEKRFLLHTGERTAANPECRIGNADALDALNKRCEISQYASQTLTKIGKT